MESLQTPVVIITASKFHDRERERVSEREMSEASVFDFVWRV